MKDHFTHEPFHEYAGTNSLEEWTSLERFRIAGRGYVFTCRCPRDLASPGELNGKWILLNGVPARVAGTDRYMKVPPPREGEVIGILIATISPDYWG